jgi:hypothetical protein
MIGGKGGGGGGGGKKGGGGNAEQRAKQAYSTGRPEKTRRLIKNFEQFFKRMYAPGLQRATDAAGMGSETLMQGFGADVARRGLSGSGADLFGRQGIRTARQSSITDATVRFYEDALRGAIGQANQTQQMQIGALTGVPVGQQGANPYASKLYDTGENMLSLWLLNQGGKGSGVPGLGGSTTGIPGGAGGYSNP